MSIRFFLGYESYFLNGFLHLLVSLIDYVQTFISINCNMKKVALVIGVDNYTHLSELSSAGNDAEDISIFLKKVGFDTKLLLNPNLRAIIKSVSDFKERVDNNTVSVVYFAGHGLQVESTNFLVPVDANISISEEIHYFCFSASDLLIDTTVESENLHIVILDSCRNNPFPSGIRGAQSGLARMTAPVGTLIAFSTSPNRVAKEKVAERNSLYTKHLLRELKVPNSSLERIFKNTRTRVIKESDGRQVPWEESSLHGEDFTFIKEPTALDLYLKKELVFAYRSLGHEKFQFSEYIGDGSSNNKMVSYLEAITLFKMQYESAKESHGLHEIFALLTNLQRIVHVAYRFALITQTINFRELDKQIVLQQDKIENDKIHEYHRVLLTMEHYGSIFMNHDRFGNFKSIKRIYRNSIWTGLKLDGDFLEKQVVLFEDYDFVKENEDALKVFIEPDTLLTELVDFFETDDGKE